MERPGVGVRGIVIIVTSNEVGPGSMEQTVKSPKVYFLQPSAEYESILNSVISIRNNSKRSSNLYKPKTREREYKGNHVENNTRGDKS